jgi:CBS-domain-containing membrane protein
MRPAETRSCIVYRAHDQHDSHVLPAYPARPAPPPIAEPEEADRTSVRTIMAHDLRCARRDLELARVTDLMVTHSIGCLPIVDDRRQPIGIITRTDLAEHLNVALRSAQHGTWTRPATALRVAEDIMMPVMFSLKDNASIADAAALMTAEDTHHLLITDAANVLVGVVSSKDVMNWVARRTARARSASATLPPTWRPVDH